jgi:radical SAM-linked protein
MRILLEFTKGPSLRWISHLDLIKVFEKAIRRANLPVALSQGFNPRPKMSIALPLPVGVSSDGEFMELELAEQMDHRELCNRLNQQLPVDMKIQKAMNLSENSPSVMSQVETSEYRVHIPHANRSDEVTNAIQNLLAKQEVLVRFSNKDGKIKILDIRPGIRSCIWCKNQESILMEIETSSRLFIRPQFVLQAITESLNQPQWSIEEIDIHRVKINLNPKIQVSMQT